MGFSLHRLGTGRHPLWRLRLLVSLFGGWVLLILLSLLLTYCRSVEEQRSGESPSSEPPPSPPPAPGPAVAALAAALAAAALGQPSASPASVESAIPFQSITNGSTGNGSGEYYLEADGGDGDGVGGISQMPNAQPQPQPRPPHPRPPHPRPPQPQPEQPQKAKPKHDTVHFGTARVMMTPGDVALGEQLWFCHQIEHVALHSGICAVPHSSSNQPYQQQQAQQQGQLPFQEMHKKRKKTQQCIFLEIGGPGLCAIDLANRLPWQRVHLYPSGRRLADMSRNATEGLGKNLQLGGNLSRHDMKRPVVLLINILRHKDILSVSTLLRGIKAIFSRGAVGAAIIALQPHASSHSRKRFTDLVERAISAGFSALWGGFDGRNVDQNFHQVFLNEKYGRRSVNIFLLPAGDKEAPTTTSTTTTSTTIDNDTSAMPRGSYIQQPPPKLHVLVPLRPQYENLRRPLMERLCRFLLDSAATRNLTTLHVLGLTANGTDFFHVVKVAQKLLVLRHALKSVNNGSLKSWSQSESQETGPRLWIPPGVIRPWDVVMVIDATDTLVQLPLGEILDRYMRAGAPVFHASTESGIWPPAVNNFTHLYDETGDTAVPLPNKYLNSGGVIGRALIVGKYVQDAAELVDSKSISESSWLPRKCTALASNPRDQGIMSFSYLLGNPYGISLDHESTFFYSVYCSSHHLVLSCGRLSYNLTSSTPAVLHGNGRDGKMRLETLRGAILDDRGPRRVNPEFQYHVDGAWVRHGDMCMGVGPITEFEETEKTAVPCPFEIPGHSYTVRNVPPRKCPAKSI